jgi:hypothetical protein
VQRDKHSIWVALSMGALFLVWLVLLVTNETTKAVEAVRFLLPSWFPTANLVLAPLLATLACASSRIPPILRLCACVLMLCSFSALYLSHASHPFAYVVVIILVFVEAFWLIPRWNSRHRREKPEQQAGSW